jgi:membrane protease YdiL (CAAX protease family)
MEIGGADLDPRNGEATGAEAKPPPRLSAYRGAVLFTMYIGAQLAFGVLAGIGIGIQYVKGGGDAADSDAINEVIRESQGIIGVAGAILGGLVFIFATLFRNRGTHGVAFRRTIGLTRASWRQIVEGAGLGIALGVLYVTLASFLWPPAQDFTPGPTSQMAMSPGVQQQTWILFALLGSPPIEEFVFRGVLLASVLASWGKTWAATLTTGLFLAMHYSELIHYWPAALSLTALSLTATALRMRSGSLGPAVSAHFGYNLVIVALVYGFFSFTNPA